MTCLHSELWACLLNINFIFSAMPYLFIQYINMFSNFCEYHWFIVHVDIIYIIHYFWGDRTSWSW